jgi:hypothetical protein
MYVIKEELISEVYTIDFPGTRVSLG